MAGTSLHQSLVLVQISPIYTRMIWNCNFGIVNFLPNVFPCPLDWELSSVHSTYSWQLSKHFVWQAKCTVSVLEGFLFSSRLFIYFIRSNSIVFRIKFWYTWPKFNPLGTLKSVELNVGWKYPIFWTWLLELNFETSVPSLNAYRNIGDTIFLHLSEYSLN